MRTLLFEVIMMLSAVVGIGYSNFFEWGNTLQLTIVVVAAVVGVVVFTTVFRRRSKTAIPPVPPEIRLVSQWLKYRFEYDSRKGWIVVSPSGKEFYTLKDVRELLA